jgi:uncharacterized FlgJ-related protein
MTSYDLYTKMKESINNREAYKIGDGNRITIINRYMSYRHIRELVPEMNKMAIQIHLSTLIIKGLINYSNRHKKYEIK